MLPVALVSMLAGSPAAAEAPPGALAPAPAELAPAPAPVERAPAPAPAELAPAPAQPSAPSSMTVTTIVTPTTTTTTTTVTVDTWSSEPAPAPVVVVTPAPTPPPLTLSPPAPTWGSVRPTPYVPPDAAQVYQAMRQHRRAALGAFVVGGLGMGATLGFQYARIRGLQHCAARGLATTECGDYHDMDHAFAYYGALGMGMLVAGTAGAGALLGNAAATRDVQLRGMEGRSRNGIKVLGVAIIGVAAGWMIGANMRLAHLEFRCDDDPRCLLQYRPLRFAAKDGAAVGVAAGAGLVGYAIGYERQGKALARLRAAPSISARHTGVAVAVEF